MKFLSLILLALLSLPALACTNYEAQFVGTVTNVKHFPAAPGVEEHYSYNIKLGFQDNYWFSAHMGCPLFETDLESATIFEAGAPRRANGNYISGILVFDSVKNEYYMD